MEEAKAVEKMWANLVRLGKQDKDALAHKAQPDTSDVAPHLLNRQ